MPISHAKTKRNLRILAQYNAGLTYKVLAAMYAISESRVCRIVHRYDGTPTALRLLANARRSSVLGGRKPVWPDCPPLLRERYEKAKKRIGAHAAKAKIQAQERLKDEIAADGALARAA